MFACSTSEVNVSFSKVFSGVYVNNSSLCRDIHRGRNEAFENEGDGVGSEISKGVLNLATLHRRLYKVQVYLGLVFWLGAQTPQPGSSLV